MWYIHDPPNVIKNNTNFQLSWIGTQNFLFNPNIQTFSSLTMKWPADPAAAGEQASWPDIDHHRDSWFLITVKNEQFHSSHTQKMSNYVTTHSQAVFFFFVCVCMHMCVCVCVSALVCMWTCNCVCVCFPPPFFKFFFRMSDVPEWYIPWGKLVFVLC